ncbi:shikimate dehydrogenase [Clostridium peptidivorans]|uniref:shikimate dehydrogenase n=1 Tax=Clostridium peptidivorans TaxID=100174 RepID=UPI000BE247C6|nr:shikimate dehydrogenase [Clostridium peptidivorans]
MKRLYGLLGEKLGHSFSPQIHSLIFKELDIDGYYHLFEVDKLELQCAILGFKALKVKGVNVTIPYKVDAIKYLDELSSEGKNIGAINTICFKDGKAIGYNTDYYGFGMMLDKFNVKVKGKNAVILGSGGASKAVLQFLLDNGVNEVIFATRNEEECKKKFNKFKAISYDKIKSLKSQDIVINCTPVGMYPNVENSPLSKEDVSKFASVVDLIYNPGETLLLKYAREQGIQGINGLYMLVGQAIKAQELWNSVKVNKETVDKIYPMATIRNTPILLGGR